MASDADTIDRIRGEMGIEQLREGEVAAVVLWTLVDLFRDTSLPSLLRIIVAMRWGKLGREVAAKRDADRAVPAAASPTGEKKDG